MGHLLDSKRVYHRTKSQRRLLLWIPDSQERVEIRELRRKIGGLVAWFGSVWLWVVVGVVLGVGLLGPMFLPWNHGAMVSLVSILGIVVFPFAAFILFLWGSGRRQASMWRALLWHGRCAVCAESLSWCEPDEEGIVGCEGCGAGWAMDRLRWGACPGCGYKLGGLPSDEHGQLCCPECGGKWRLPRVAGGGGG